MSSPTPSAEPYDHGRASLLRKIAGLAADAIFAMNLEGELLLWNRGAERLYGWKEEEVLGKCVHDLLKTRFPVPLAKVIQTAKADGEWRGEVVHTTRSGERMHVESRLSPNYDENGSLISTFEINRDLTKEKRIQQQMNLQVAALEAAANAIVITDADANIVWANQAFSALTGYTTQEAIGQNPRILKSGKHEESFYEKLWSTIKAGHVWHGEITNRAKDGHLYVEEMTIAPVHSAAGEVSNFIAIKQNVTDRKASEEALRQAEEKYREIYENAIVGIFRTTPEGRYLGLNRELARMYGYESPEERMTEITNIGRQAYVDPSRRQEFMNLIEQKGVLRNFEYEVYRRDGSRMWLSENARVVRDSNGRALYYEGTVEDITERKSLEQQLRQSQKLQAVGCLAGGVAHDFNNILGVIVGYAEISQGKLESIHPVTKDLAQIKIAAQRAASLTRQLLAFSRQQVFYPRVLDLSAVVSNASDMLRRLVGEDISITVMPAITIDSIRADVGQIEQVLMNLVVNARDAMPNGGDILIGIETAELDESYAHEHPPVHSGRYVMLSVSDTGCGMDETTKSRIFEPFFTTKELGKGTGLGLSTVYGIVKQSGGYIWVYSELGRGTTFRMYFPRVDDAAEPIPLSGAEVESVGGSETILLVEDDAALRSLIASFLQDVGYKVLQAEDADTAVRLSTEITEPIQLLLTDVIMPKMSGIELSKCLKAARPSLKLLLMSGYAGDSLARRGALAPEMVLLEKPFSKSSLLSKIRATLHE